MNKKNALSFITFLCALIPLHAQPINSHLDDYDVSITTSTGQNLYYVIRNSTAHVVYHSSYDTGMVGSLIIPDSITFQGSPYPVTSLSMAYVDNNGSYSGTFYHCTRLTSIELPNTIDTINGLAFSTDSNLSSITIPPSVTFLGFRIFHGCSSLTSINIPNSVSYIDGGLFSRCNSLSSVIVDSLNPYFDSRNDCNAIIETATNTLVAGCNMTTIPNSVVEIGYQAFSSCNMIGTDFVIPQSVEKIDYSAFSWSILPMLELPGSLKYIGDFAFEGCSGFDTVEIPVSVDSIGGLAFSQCTSLTTIIYNAQNCQLTGYNTSYSPFRNCTNLTTLIIGDSVQYIHNHFFANLNSIERIESHNYVPPVLYQGSLYGIPTTTPVIVPCGRVEAYINAPYWTGFSNIMEDGTCANLCMVSVQDGHNTLVWNKEHEVVAYNLFREGNVAGTYDLIATIPFDSMSVYVDVESHPTTRSYRYKMNAVLDSTEAESSLSKAHKTMHLSINQGLGGRWNLSWTPYEGAEYTTYIIYRGTSATDLQQIDIMPADGNTSYSDETAPDGDVYYQVGIVMSTPCASGPDSTTGTKSTSISRSNIATNSAVGISEVVDIDGIKVFSKNNRILIDGLNGQDVTIYTIDGRAIASLPKATEHVAIPVIKTGVYIVKIGDHPARKVVVIR